LAEADYSCAQQQEEAPIGKVVVVVEVCYLDDATPQDLVTSTQCICLLFVLFLILLPFDDIYLVTFFSVVKFSRRR
jgi:hypothetical protein